MTPNQGRDNWKSRLKRGMKTVAEAAAALLLVLLVFAGFLTLLERLFPTGTTFRQLMERKGGVSELEQSAADRERTDIRTGGGAGDEAAALLSVTVNEVRSKRSTSIAWGPAERGMPLYNRDAVQTLRGAGATITFDKENYMTMGSNTLVIIRRMENDRLLRQQRSVLVMVEGEMRGRIAGSAEQGMALEIATPEAMTRIRSDHPDAEAEFRITVHPDQSSSVVVFAGEAQVTLGGVTMTVAENQGVILRPGQSPAGPVELPPPPALQTPRDGATFTYRHLPPQVRFAWGGGAEKFRFQLSADPEFASPLVDEVLDGPEFMHGNLRAGTWYWRTAAVHGGIEGETGTARALTLVESRTPPPLDVAFPETTRGERVVVAGKTAPGSFVYVDSLPVTPAPDGAFSLEVSLTPGLNSILVEAIDEAGNASYRRGIIQRNP